MPLPPPLIIGAWTIVVVMSQPNRALMKPLFTVYRMKIDGTVC